MLPGIRILFALVVLSFAILTFGFGALALLRTAHQNLASQPVWQQDWRTPVEIANAQRDDHQPPAGGTQTLALLQVDAPTAKPEMPATQPQAQDAQDKATSVDAAADISAPPPPVSSPSAADTSDNDKAVAAAATVEIAAPSAKTAEQTSPRVPPTDDPGKVAAQSDELKVADLPNPPSDQAAQPTSAPDTNAAPLKTNEGAPPRDVGETLSSPPQSVPRVRLTALPDTTTASSEPRPQARQQGVRQSGAAELRAKRRARARLRARRLAQARARAARLAQTQQTTNSSYYNSNFTTTGSGATNTTTNATPFGAPRSVP